MSFKAILASLPILWQFTTAFPAGPGFFPNGTSPLVSTSDFHIASTYNLVDQYDASNWMSKFDVQNIADPTHGFVDYVDRGEAQQLGLLKTQDNQVYMGVDTTSHLDPNGPGRKSVRLQSKVSYNRALIIADFAHVPGTACGSWPAYWMVGPNWPSQGELDIYEGVNLQNNNQITLHTSPGCSPGVGPGGETGSRVGYADCGAGGGYNGCGVVSDQATSYGTPFNANGGGVYATLWTSQGIKVWYFSSKDVPDNIRSNHPNPDSWGVPAANYGNGGCDFDARFRDMSIVFDITFCGDWAGGAWGSSSCSQMNPSCNAYVAGQPQSFGDVYWLINSIKVYSV